MSRRFALTTPVLVAGLALASGSAAHAAGVEAGPREPFGPREPTTITPKGAWLQVSTVPSKRASESIGINVDVWRKDGAYTEERWPKVLQGLKDSGIRKARTSSHLAGDRGTKRQIEMGKAGFRFNIEMGDAFGRYASGPLPAIFDQFKNGAMPYAEAVEGTNEPDVAGPLDWGITALDHQREIIKLLAATPGGDKIAVFAPATARPLNQKWWGELGGLGGLADYANAHAYSSGLQGALGFDRFVPPAAAVIPNGATVVTEAGVHTGLEGNFQQPGVSEAVQARYMPKILLEGIRRGIPRTYLFDLIDRYVAEDRVEAHFGIMRVDGSRKPAFNAIARLTSELRDPKGNVAATTAPVLIKPKSKLPDDVRMVAVRHSDGSLVLALWRERQLFDLTTKTPIASPVTNVHLDLGESYVVGKARNLVSGKVAWSLPFLSGVDVKLGDDITVVRLSHRIG